MRCTVTSASMYEAAWAGVAASDQAGILGPLGDLDHDGNVDLVVGASYQGASDNGSVYLVFGPLDDGTASLSSADVTLTGGWTTGERAGSALAFSIVARRRSRCLRRDRSGRR